MRILTLSTGPEAARHVLLLTAEIRRFNAEIDFRLRFLDIEIRQSVAAGAHAADDLRTALRESGGGGEAVVPLDEERPLAAAATLAVRLERERPDLVVVAGDGPLADAGAAAAAAAGIRCARFGRPGDAPASGDTETLDLGAEAGAAVDRLTGVAREIR